MSPEAIIRSIEANLAEFLLALGQAGGGEELREGGVHWTVGGSPIAYHNAVVRADLRASEADRVIEQFVARLRDLDVPGSWHVGPSTRPADLCERLRAHGFSACDEGAEPGMAADLNGLPPNVAAPEGLLIERIRDQAALEGFRRVLAAGFGEGEPEANWVCSMYAQIGLGDETEWRHYLGTIAGEPVSTTSVFFGAGVAGIYFVCTEPRWRRQGFGAATTLRALQEAREAGYTWAVLGSSAMGYGVYERLGFREYCRVQVAEFDPHE